MLLSFSNNGSFEILSLRLYLKFVMNLIPLESSTSIPYAYIGVHFPEKISLAPQLISLELF